MEKQKDRRKRSKNWHLIAVLIALFDIVVVNAAYFLALWFRFDCAYSAIAPVYLESWMKFAPIYTVLCLVVFYWQQLYRSIWRYASMYELCRVGVASLITTAVQIMGTCLLFKRMPISYYLLGAAIQFLLILGIRFFYRFISLMQQMRTKSRMDRVMLIGAGRAGRMILKSIREQGDMDMRVLCFIDDDPNAWGRSVLGVPVVGGRDCIMETVEKFRIDKIFVTMPSASDEDRRDILNICKETGCDLKSLPGILQLVNGKLTTGDMKDVAVEDLLGRDPIRVNMEEIYEYIGGKTVLVTGGGGSIGSELCRQVAAHRPKRLIIFDVYENNAYEIEQELRTNHPDVDLQVRIGSVRDSRCLDSIFAQYKPDLVYHAAAHKHVPLMENSPCEAIKNNVIGTYKTAYAAMMHGCKRFVLISTDKAVNPTNIMGASKRLCEMVIQSFDKAVKTGTADRLPKLYTHREDGECEMELPATVCTEYVAVRFGNVLGSNGSVIPLFKKQIQRGGPVTVTHPDIIRYFMTIPEAVSLVMQAGT